MKLTTITSSIFNSEERSTEEALLSIFVKLIVSNYLRLISLIKKSNSCFLRVCIKLLSLLRESKSSVS